MFFIHGPPPVSSILGSATPSRTGCCCHGGRVVLTRSLACVCSVAFGGRAVWLVATLVLTVVVLSMHVFTAADTRTARQEQNPCPALCGAHS